MFSKRLVLSLILVLLSSSGFAADYTIGNSDRHFRDRPWGSIAGSNQPPQSGQRYNPWMQRQPARGGELGLDNYWEQQPRSTHRRDYGNGRTPKTDPVDPYVREFLKRRDSYIPEGWNNNSFSQHYSPLQQLPIPTQRFGVEPRGGRYR